MFGRDDDANPSSLVVVVDADTCRRRIDVGNSEIAGATKLVMNFRFSDV